MYIASNARHVIITDIQSVGLSALNAGSIQRVIISSSFKS